MKRLAKRLAVLSVLALPFVLASCMSPSGKAPDASAKGAAGEGRSCFFLNQVTGFSRAPGAKSGSAQILVHVGVKDSYLFETLGPCPDLDWSERLGFAQRTPGTICEGIDVDLIVPGGIGPRRCPVRMIRKLTPEEAKAK